MKILITGGSGFIGTNLVDGLINQGHEILNVDIVSPKKVEHNSFWVNCDILDSQKLNQYVSSFNPEWVIHLAARVDSDGKTLEDYKVNIQGTANLINIIKKNENIKRFIVTSTEFVNYGGSLPISDEEYHPYTVYGESKVELEKLTRNAQLDCIWTIIRPTRVWGYWQPDRIGFYRMLYRGLYIHPGKEPVTRAFGYVGNVVHQVIQILTASKETVNGKVFYVGDDPINLIDWVEGFSRRINNKRVIYAPRLYIKILALLGDMLGNIGIPFPISSFRYNSLITSDDAPMKLTFDTFGYPPYTLDQAIDETVKLIKVYHPEFRGEARHNVHT